MKLDASTPSYTVMQEVRCKVLTALRDDGAVGETLAARLEEASQRAFVCAPADDIGRRARLWRGFAQLVDAASKIAHWDVAIRAAEPDADRYQRAAIRIGETLHASLPTDEPVFLPLLMASARVVAVNSPDDLGDVMAYLRSVSLPMPLVPGKIATNAEGKHAEEPSEEAAPPTVVCMLSIDDTLIVREALVKPGRMYRLGVRCRLASWPPEARTLEIRFISSDPPHLVTLPQLAFQRPDLDDDGLYTVSGSGTLHLAAAQSGLTDEPMRFPVHLLMATDEKPLVPEVEGYQELRVRSYDPQLDFLTGLDGLDTRLVEMFARLQDAGFDDGERQAFVHFFAAIARAAARMQEHRIYADAPPVNEDQFHDDLETLLKTDAALGGRVARGTKAGGGPVDLLHDGVVAELKLEKENEVSIDSAIQYLGQPTQYSASSGHRLSILVVCDTSAKVSPIGVLENYVGWLEPKLHGLTDPDYPSLVAVLVVNPNLDVPSSWKRRISIVEGSPADGEKSA